MKMDFALNNLQWLIWYKPKPNQTKPNHFIVLLFNREEIHLIE